MPVTSSRQKSAQGLVGNHSLESYGERMEEKGGCHAEFCVKGGLDRPGSVQLHRTRHGTWSRPASLSFLVSGEGFP